MKKILLFAVLVIVLASCKKSSSGIPANSITATINDTVHTFNTSLIDTTIYSDSTLIVLLEATDVNLNKLAIELFARKTTPLKAITYGTTADTLHQVGVGYIAPEGTNYYSQPPYDASYPLTVNVTTLNSTTIQGTFKGTLFLNGEDTTNSSKIPVTNGTFSFTKPTAAIQ